ncbi:hypothetical protein [Xenorhabdus kozodoii]|uniref:Uncharacterized protein n=1 Tax=Xenorhabdus kozodoii TaxID=351676 RepID=A0A2D0LDA7_9GAMM|nr:hypothetical protein [Xenorhabdus kozodoii]PHM73688.1 hypothetical protein Xkoz_01509 [Xenorhabdus kozodoii]
MNQLTRVQHQYKVTGGDFNINTKVTGTNKKENPLMMTLVSIGLATTLLTPLLSIL